MPQKNPYLTQHKENIRGQRNLFLQRADVPSLTRDQGNLKPVQKETSFEIHEEDDGEFPSIDQEDDDDILLSSKRPPPVAPRRQSNRRGSNSQTPDYITNTSQQQKQQQQQQQQRTHLQAKSERSNYQTPRPATLNTNHSNNRYKLTESSLDTPPSIPLVNTRPTNTSFSSLTRAVDEFELARSAGLSRVGVNRTRQSPSPQQQRATETVSPPVTASPMPSEGTFSRKPLYNSLLRAHDSIRLKVNRPKVRPKSEQLDPQSGKSLTVDDTEIDDSIQLVDINSTPNLTNERAIDVKRRSSKKKKDKSKQYKSKNQEEEEENDEQRRNADRQSPVRQFSEVRIVKIERSKSERALGVTVKADAGNIVVARILAGSLADKQGALQVGDVILSVNNNEVYTPEQLQEQLRRALDEDTVLLKIVPSFREELPTLCIYLRALFQYDPNEDSLLPCKEVGVTFNQGDILEVVNQEDPNWWQARRVDSENLQVGLIPSQELEERRRAFVLPDYDLATRTSICGTKVSKKSKKKEIYNVGQNNDFDKAELQLYEEVCRTPAFERRTLVLIGANGVGKQAFKHRLVSMDPDRFGTPLPHTSRLPREGEEDGIHYYFVTREKMEEDILAGNYLEFGEFDGALYGTKLDSVREIIGSGKVCVLDCSPTCLKVLKTSDYLPFVAFIAAPTLDQLRYMHEYGRNQHKTYATFDRALSRQSRRAKTLQDFAFDFFEDEDLQVTVEESARLFRVYENYFDIVLVNDNFDRTFEQLREAIDALSMAPQWIPISWIYGT